MRFNRHDVCVYIYFVLKLYLYIQTKIRDGDPYDPSTDDMGHTGGAIGGGDENPQDYKFPDTPTETPDQRRWEKKGAKPKDPYAYKKTSSRR